MIPRADGLTKNTTVLRNKTIVSAIEAGDGGVTLTVQAVIQCILVSLLLGLTQSVRKLTGLPDRKLLDIMAMSHVLERKDAPAGCLAARLTPGTSPRNRMVIVSSYVLEENPEKGVFCEERGADTLSLL